MTTTEDLLIEIQNRHTEANMAVVNAVAALQRQLADHTAAIQQQSQWRPVDSGGVSGGTYDFTPQVGKISAWTPKGRVGGDQPPGYKAITIGLNAGKWYQSAAKPLGVVAKIGYAVENQLHQEVLVDVPAGGLISVPLCAGEVTVDFLLTQIAFTATEMQATDGTPNAAFNSGIGWPNYPQPAVLSLAVANSSPAAPLVQLGMSAFDSIGRTSSTLPSRKISVHTASGEGSFPLYFPYGTQAFLLQGPADATFNQQDVSGNFPVNRINAAVTPNVISQLMPGAQYILCSSAGGGYFSATFFLGT